MEVDDLVQTAGRSCVRLHEKRGKVDELPIHHKLLDRLDAYLAITGHWEDPTAPLFRSARGRMGELTVWPMLRYEATAMVRGRASAAGVVAKIGDHSFRGIGIGPRDGQSFQPANDEALRSERSHHPGRH